MDINRASWVIMPILPRLAWSSGRTTVLRRSSSLEFYCTASWHGD